MTITKSETLQVAKWQRRRVGGARTCFRPRSPGAWRL